jgi:protein-L-isoaspartate(D-aspartate) O-methyltransferase
MSDYELARANMIERQIRPNTVTDERVIRAFAALRREQFVPKSARATSYADSDLPLGGGRCLMTPMVAARLIQALQIASGDTALVVGAGVGYEAAVIAQLARTVVAVEEEPVLARLGREALVEHRIANVKYFEESVAQGSRARPAYNVVLFGGAIAEVPEDIATQVAEGGRIAAIIRNASGPGRATLLTRTGGVLAHRVMFDAATPMLPGFVRTPVFVF